MSYLKSKYNQKFIRDNNLIIAEAVIGSHAFNLHNEKSDVDMYGIFYLHKDDFFSLNHRVDTGFKDVVEKENPHDDDITYMEIGKFFELLNNNNPNVLELASAIIKQDFGGMIENLDMSKILSKKCEKSFGGYAIAQIKKARGLNKKIVNPVGEVRKTPLDFCRLMDNGQTYELRKWLEKRNLDQKFCGVVNLSNARDSYGLYYDVCSEELFSGKLDPIEVEQIKELRRTLGRPMGYGFKGIEHEDGKSNEIRLSSIPKMEIDADSGYPVHTDIKFLGNISYNKDGYIKHCKDYEQYWKWVENRNPERYNNNLKQNYDTKNISHCVRLLSVAKEIGEGKGLILKRTDDRQFLMDIKYGKVEYEVAMAYAENIMKDLPELYKNSNLPDVPDYEYLNHALIEYRKSFY
jgi:hypothetical protein